MNLLKQFWQGLAMLTALLCCTPAHASSTACSADSALLEHSFASGASWSVCAQVNDYHGLQLDAVHYRAPGDTLRKVLHSLHAGQILLHYHHQPQASVQIGYENPEDKARSGRTLDMSTRNCDGDLLLETDGNPKLCSRIQNNRILARYAQQPSLQSQNWELTSAFQRDSLIWAVSITLTEDGQISPAISLSGRAEQTIADSRFASAVGAANQDFARATVLTTWRLVFDLDSSAQDRVFQFEFPLDEQAGNRRPMQILPIVTEVFTNVARDDFRGWQVRDETGAGYYLDPSNSGFSYRSNSRNWAQFDLAISNYSNCEQHAAANHSTGDDDPTICGNSLDDFINGESLEAGLPVLWFSQTRTLNLSNEDWPIISNFYQSFDLLPFEWTSASPFEVIE